MEERIIGNQMKMKVEIWSDVICPFCYIGKRKFEQALQAFPGKEQVEVEWHSYQLNPEMKDQPDKDVYAWLAEVKGQSREWSVQMHGQVTEMARKAGLEYRFDKAKVANSFQAHRLIQYAKTMGKDDAVEERLFRAYFTDGERISDVEALIRLAVAAGLDETETRKMFGSERFGDDVRYDQREAGQLGATGVPFFVFDRKYVVTGAQDSSVFRQVLEKSFGEWKSASGN